MIYGYARVSTSYQNTENQRFEIANFAQKSGFVIDKWVMETISSKKDLKKRKLSGLLRKIKKRVVNKTSLPPITEQVAARDVIVVSEISRLGRNLFEIMRILDICIKKECEILTIKENLRLGDNMLSKILMFVFGLVAELERQFISQRTKEALARRKAEGVKLGRPRKGLLIKKLGAFAEDAVA